MNCNKFNNVKWMKQILFVFTLVLVDQIIKIIIIHKLADTYYEIWKGWIEFQPKQNMKQSWFGTLGIPIMDNREFIIALRICILWIGFRTYNYCLKILNKKGQLIQIGSTLFFAGTICSIIDSIYWKGSIDYIRIINQITFDLKDCYISIVIILMIISSIVYRQIYSGVKLIEIGRHILLLKEKD